MSHDEKSNPPRVQHLKKYRGFLPFIPGLYGALFFVLLIYFGDKPSILFGGLMFVIGLFFTVKGKKISMIIPGFKSFYTGLAWACMVIFTAVYCSEYKILPVLLFFIFVFIRITINVSFCDIKDIDADRAAGLKTLVMIFKNRDEALNFLHVLNIFSFIFLITGVIIHAFQPYTLFLMFSFFNTFYYTQRAKNPDTDISSLSYIVADGELLFWPFFIFIGMLLLP